MKLNLACGQDIREGYINIDLNPINEKLVKRGDIKNLSNLNILDGSCEEIVAIDVLNCIKFKEIASVLQHWFDKLSLNGEMYFESLDYNLIGTKMATNHITVADVNTLLFNGEGGIYNLSSIESHMINLGMITKSKGYREDKFFLRMIKQ